jgi:hypothetical protein
MANQPTIGHFRIWTVWQMTDVRKIIKMLLVCLIRSQGTNPIPQNFSPRGLETRVEKSREFCKSIPRLLFDVRQFCNKGIKTFKASASG